MKQLNFIYFPRDLILMFMLRVAEAIEFLKSFTYSKITNFDCKLPRLNYLLSFFMAICFFSLRKSTQNTRIYFPEQLHFIFI